MVNKKDRHSKSKKKCFKFRKEIGWAEIIATIALLISFYNFYAENKQDLSTINGTYKSAIYTEKDGSIKYFMFNRTVITNNGNKPVTLLSLKANKDFGPTLVNADSSNVAKKKDLPFEIFQIADSVFTGNLFQKQENLLQFTHQGLEKLSHINQIIYPGGTYTLTIGIKYSLPADMSIRFLLFAGELEFSNGEILDFGSGGDISYHPPTLEVSF